MQNKLSDLNNHLFVMLEKLNDDEICKDKESVMIEIAKAKAICEISKEIVSIAETQLEGVKLVQEYGLVQEEIPKTLGVSLKYGN